MLDLWWMSKPRPAKLPTGKLLLSPSAVAASPGLVMPFCGLLVPFCRSLHQNHMQQQASKLETGFFHNNIF